MKKWAIFCMVVMFIFALPLDCMAKTFDTPAPITKSTATNDQVLLGSGYTEDGVYYEVYGERITTNPNARLNIEVERTVVYDGKVMPLQTISWVEDIGGYEFRGTLTLSSFYYDAATDKTTGIYVGTITN